MRRTPGRVLLALVAACTFGAAPASAQRGNFWETKEGLNAAAAVQLLTCRNAITAVTIRLAASESGLSGLLEPEWRITIEKIPPLRQDWLDLIRDGTPIPDLRAKAPDEISKADHAFYLAFNQAIYYAWITSPEVFAEAGKLNAHVTFDDLWIRPDDFRGRVVPVQGKLMRVQKKEAPRIAHSRGVDFVYEGYIQTTKRRNPVGIVFVNLPDGVPVSDELDRPVTFYGYFIKKFRYPAGDATRETHLLIGPTIFVGEQPPTGTPPPNPVFSREILLFTLGGLMTVGLVLFLLTLWFRQGDRKVEQQLAQMRDRRPLQLDAERPADETLPGTNGHHPPDDSGPKTR